MSGIRVGVDVGGTFTKAVAVDLDTLEVVAQSMLPTTHDAPEGVAAGVVAAVAAIADEAGAGAIQLVVHSTTQAVNALLEGDMAAVGVIGLGTRPELRQARKRTRLADVEVAPGRRLRTIPVFFDVTDGLDELAVLGALDDLKARGAGAVCVAEAFAPEDSTNERRVAELAEAAGFLTCTSADLSGLFGLEMRAVTAALNASVLPLAADAARFVADGVARAGIEAPLLIMRGDGGATDLAGFRAAPARTLYSGPAASVAGALRHTNTADAIVTEIGGTSTNVTVIRHGHPTLSYVQVGRHVTALRAVDVRVIGVAGGSMLRVRRNHVYGVGPRSAHIAGLPYAAYAPAGTFTSAAAATSAAPAPSCTAVTFSPLTGDPDDYLAVDDADGRRWALTNTCAAVALGITEDGDYAHTDASEARAAFAVAVEAQAGAGGLGRHVAAMLRVPCTVPPGAEVISSIGDALSLIRAERERTMEGTDAAAVDGLVAEVEAEAAAAGAAPMSIEVRVEEQAEKGTVRAVATGAIALASGAVPGRPVLDEVAARARLRSLGVDATPVGVGRYWIATTGGKRSHVTVLDRWGDPIIDVDATALIDAPDEQAVTAVGGAVRNRGPVTIQPMVWIISGNRLTELSSGDRVAATSETLRALHVEHARAVIVEAT